MIFSDYHLLQDRHATDAFVKEFGQAKTYQENTGKYGIALPVWRGKKLTVIHRRISINEEKTFRIHRKKICIFDSLNPSFYTAKWALQKLKEKIIKDESVTSRITNKIRWALNRAKEIPFLIKHPSVILQKFYRKRVRNVISRLQPTKIKIKLSKILSAHPIEGNARAVRIYNERLAILQKNQQQFDKIHQNNQVLTAETIQNIMKSTSPIQPVFSDHDDRCVILDGNSRLIALKRFIAETYPNWDPEIEMNAYQVDARLLQSVMPSHDYSLPQNIYITPV